MLSLLAEMLCPSPRFPHSESLYPAKHSSWVSLSRKLLCPHRAELMIAPSTERPLPSKSITIYTWSLLPWTESLGSKDSLPLWVLGTQWSTWYRRDTYIDEVTRDLFFVCADRLERPTEKNLWGRKPNWIHFPVPQIKRRKSRRTSWWCGTAIMSGQKIGVPSEKSRWAQLEACLARRVLSF